MKKLSKKIIIPIITAVCIGSLTLVCLLIFSPHKLSELEQISFNEKTQDITYFLDIFDKKDEISDEAKAEIPKEQIEETEKRERLLDTVGFAMQLNYANTGGDELSADEIVDIIKKHLDIDVDSDKMHDEMILQGLSSRYVQYDEEKDKYIFRNPYDVKKVIALTPVTVYLLKSVKSKGGEYYAVYDKYVIDNPYTALNRTSQDDIPHEHSINDYLNGHGTPMSIKEVITPENIVDIASESSEVEVVYKLEGNNILFKEIKK